MALQPFTSNFADNSTEAGFQFTFYCDICKEGYKSKFIESKIHKKTGLLNTIGKVVSIGASLLGKYNVGWTIEKGTDVITGRYKGMPPQWHKEHEAAFELAQNEAKQHFHRCPKCLKYVCDNDWNEQEGLCINDAPRVNVEVAAAKAKKAVDDIYAKAATTQIFTGEIESKQTMCPQCGKPTNEGKFCNNCGASLLFVVCNRCGTKSPIGTKFCGECGTKLE